MLQYGKSSGIISDNKLIHLPLCYKYYHTIQGRNERVQGESNSPDTEITMGAPNDCGGRRKFPTMSQILPSMQFASIRLQVQIWDRQIWFLPRTPSNLVTTLVSCRSTPESRTALQGRNEGKGDTIPQALNHCGGRRKSQQYHKCFLQCSKFAPERAQVRTWGRQSCFLPRAPSNLATPRLHWQHTRNCFLALQAS